MSLKLNFLNVALLPPPPLSLSLSQQIVLELNGVMLAHEDLVSDLRHFVTGVLPANRITDK